MTIEGLAERTRRIRLPSELLIGAGLALFALIAYIVSNPTRGNLYNHFVWQADAWLDGRFAIPWPVAGAAPANDYFRDVLPLPGQPGFGLLPYPPLPALILLPLVAASGLEADAALVACLIGAVNVGLAWRLVRCLTDDVAAAALATFFYAFGTVAWYAAALGSTWFFAHLVAITFLMLAITAAIDADRATARLHPSQVGRRLVDLVDGRQFVAGMLFGTAALARLTTIFGATFFLFVGGGGSFGRRALSAGLGAAVPVLALVVYNVASTGHLFNPVYEYLYLTEYVPHPEMRHADWGIEDLRYIPQNLLIMLGWLPTVRFQCGAGLFDANCPLLAPDPLGMSLLLVSPAYLLVVPALARWWRDRLAIGAALAVAGIAVVNLAHFSQGWVQFGYRFSNDFAPFALVLVTVGIARVGWRPLSVALVGASILVNAWGVYWGVALRW
ncbi:MAG: hypothetical protein H0X16_00015 [Chloroflexi bacterium]|nr:hypothetical protein [Chloroflexota bacterium]